ncbi:39S ribosomal protein L50, mitochondrial [Drosophila guanche]|uniref:Large ribosomal subunit protein mL50 n=1 Tax=Drosophila guanche TaxID=7266 RepID=A0A3B0J3J1_DROGU|nr:39S ribosomal protein L50, mitochondrial [Drosophila guanche]SPP76224.1 blast:39S ribosomal protein L50%2C mitochondrial [Drosophila guanche]
MAAILRKGKNLVGTLHKCYATGARVKKSEPVKGKTLAAVGESIAAKGFLRPHKPYAPPSNAAERVRSVAGSLQLPSDNRRLDNLSEKFAFLSACFQELQHGVPNSQVHELITVADVIAFYQTPVDTISPLDALKRTDLPENLHIQYEYLRFNPDTDTKFNGKTAFPKSSTLVTGLKYRGKYQGHEAKRSWP